MTALLLALVLAQASGGGMDAVRAHMECVRDQVAKLDDGQVNPEQLAKRIVPLCHAEHEKALQASGGAQATLGKNSEELEVMHTWAAVLWARQQAKATP